MRIRYDNEADVIYLRFREDKIIESDEIKEGVIIDYDSEGRAVAIEILNDKKILTENPEVIVELSPALIKV